MRIAFLEVPIYLVYIETSIRSDPNGSGNRAGDAIGALKVKSFDVQGQQLPKSGLRVILKPPV